VEGEGGEAQHEVNGPERARGCDMGRIRRSRGVEEDHGAQHPQGMGEEYQDLHWPWRRLVRWSAELRQES
jgi:hypothetical protein